MTSDAYRRLASRKGALASWANTVDRADRTSPARAKGPSQLEWHLNRLPAKFDAASESQRMAAADAARRAYFTDLAMRSARSRRRSG